MGKKTKSGANECFSFWSSLGPDSRVATALVKRPSEHRY